MNVTVSTVASIAVWVVEKALGKLLEHRLEPFLSRMELKEDVRRRLELQMQGIKIDLDRAAGMQIQNEGLVTAIDELRQLAGTAENLLDELDYYRLQELLQPAQTAGAGTKRSLPEISYPFFQSPSKHPQDIRRRIEQVKEDLEKIADAVRPSLHLEGLHSISRAPETTTTVSRTTSFSSTRVFGRAKETERIVELLTGAFSHRGLSVLPIVGIGGIGKTTLARVVYNHQRVVSHFDLRVWISLSFDFDEVDITRQILEYVAGDRHEGIKNLNRLYEILVYHLQFRTFLLVLDGMWSDKETQSWENLLDPLRSGKAKGNVILATTRNPSVVRMISEEEVICLEGIKEDEYWSLFRECAFGDKSPTNLGVYEGIGHTIATRLQGHPLAAKSVGTLLKSKMNVGEWTKILESREWKHLQKKEDVIPTLGLSYIHLPMHLQRCFAICSLFPKNYKFYGEDLFRIWAAQDLLNSRARPEQIGSEYLESLVDTSFFNKVSLKEMKWIELPIFCWVVRGCLERSSWFWI